jgi:hypothetical protein
MLVAKFDNSDGRDDSLREEALRRAVEEVMCVFPSIFPCGQEGCFSVYVDASEEEVEKIQEHLSYSDFNNVDFH